jgi:hypothetical protein
MFGEYPDVFCGSRIILKVSLPLRDREKSRTAQLGGGMSSTECPLVVYIFIYGRHALVKVAFALRPRTWHDLVTSPGDLLLIFNLTP